MGKRKVVEPPSYVHRLREVLASPIGRVLMRATAVALLLLVGGVVMRQARAQAYAMDEYRLTPAQIGFAELPHWADDNIRRELANERHYPRFSTSIFNPDAEANVRAAVAAHPLVETVGQVDVRYPHSVTVRPVLRRPVAIVSVQVKERYIKARGATAIRTVLRKRLLADDGSLLPSGPYAGYLKRLRRPLPEIRGIRAAAPSSLGITWEDRHGQVAEAVAAADVTQRLFRDTRGRAHVTSLDVSRFPSPGDGLTRGEISFSMVVQPVRKGERPRRVRVEWGRTERDCRDVPHEDCYVDKLARLERAISRRLPRSGIIDVRFPDADG